VVLGMFQSEMTRPKGGLAELMACQLRRMIKRDNLTLEKVDSSLGEIQETCKRIEKIIDGLRAFSRESGHDPLEVARLDKIIEDTLGYCEKRIRNWGIKLILDMLDPKISVECRPVQISEILLNLLNNSFDSVCKGPSSWITISVMAKGKQVDISVVDSGKGVSRDIQEKMFQPFFTTKAVGEGTGLGLSISKGLAEVNGGKLTYDFASPNTRFILTLKRA